MIHNKTACLNVENLTRTTFKFLKSFRFLLDTRYLKGTKAPVTPFYNKNNFGHILHLSLSLSLSLFLTLSLPLSLPLTDKEDVCTLACIKHARTLSSFFLSLSLSLSPSFSLSLSQSAWVIIIFIAIPKWT